MQGPPPNWNGYPATEDSPPRDWSRLGILVAFQPFSWKLGIDRSEWRCIVFDVGCFRLSVAWP